MNFARLKNAPGATNVYNHVIETLIQNLNDKDIKIYTGASSGVVGGGSEAVESTGLTESSVGDARYLPAMAASKIGPWSYRKDELIRALNGAAQDSNDSKVKEWVETALKAIR